MKVRIKPIKHFGTTYFHVQKKVWYGWKTIYDACILKYTFEFIEDLKKIADVEFIKYD